MPGWMVVRADAPEAHSKRFRQRRPARQKSVHLDAGLLLGLSGPGGGQQKMNHGGHGEHGEKVFPLTTRFSPCAPCSPWFLCLERRQPMTSSVKPIPDGYHTVTPYLTVQGVVKLID